ncbi:polysaccharide biosynthesis/export family protein [Fibrobacter sp. UWEL]|uniref:polysaccharide biosynthesis/export family protein n=1 Tax=Fibrobacter sp. UWEL TaxID=1896209 RepID=UPI00090FEEAC|nr:polysaccharide biosynthesis/export family protein [Fibrobacter sp. UWEL]SHL08728.1 polysaccharide export outer membrane protein [Fibrobacter sp. UWEL]
MKRLSVLFCGAVALLMNGCVFAPQMRMDLPSDSAEFNGLTVRVHSIDQGDFGQTVAANGEQADDLGNLKELMVDSLPALEYRIGPLDMVQVVVWEHPELTSPMGQYQPAGQKVTTDGTLFYPYAGEIKVAGLTAQELRKEITTRLSNKILNDPQVDVRVTGYNSLRATVTGAVNRPGSISFSEAAMTLPLAVAAAGGFSEEADPAGIQLRRGNKVYSINYMDAFKNNLPLDRIVLNPDDQLFVPALSETQKENKVYVLGEVGRVGVVNLNHGSLSLVEALANAGGLQALNASASSIYVLRNSGEKQIDVFHLNGKNAMALAMADRFDLNPRDIVYVDASGLATWNRLVSLISPTEMGVYYGVLTGVNTNNLVHALKD